MAEQTVLVPDIGGAEGAEVVDLLVQVGDDISVEQSLLVLESDKASMEIPAPFAGTVKELLVKVGDELSEGAQVLIMTVSEALAEADSADTQDVALSPVEPEPSAAAPEPIVDAENNGAGEDTTELQVVVPDSGSDGDIDLTEVYVAVGDTVAEGDSLVVLESDKASMEVPAPASGEITAVMVEAGISVSTGQPLVTMKTAGGAASTPAVPTLQAQAAAPANSPAPTPKAPAPAKNEAPAANDNNSVYAGPAVRKLAREFGVALERVNGSGPRGRILKEDLHQYVSNALSGGAATALTGTGIPPVPEVDFAAFGEISEEPLSRLAKLTAANMQRSWLNVPHVTQFDDADITDMEAFRKTLKAEGERRGTKLTPMPFIMLACARVLRQHPKFLSSLSGDGESLITKDYCHVGMAVDTPAGLVVPVVRDADKKNLWELAADIQELAAKARDRKLRPDDMQGGCFTISSLGGIGGRGFTPIINTPEVGILAVSKAAAQPVWNGQQFEPRTLLPLSLSYDHRVINGGDAGRFLSQLVTTLGDIRHLLL